MKSDVTVRRADLASDDDAEAVVAMVDAYAADPMGIGRPLDAKIREAVIAGLRQSPSTVIFLAFSGSGPVGVAVCFEMFATFAGAPALNVHDLAVHPDHRGIGIGRALLEAAIDHARQLGAARVTLEVRDDNDRAQRLYRHLGFGPTHANMAHWRLNLPVEE